MTKQQIEALVWNAVVDALIEARGAPANEIDNGILQSTADRLTRNAMKYYVEVE